MKILLTGAAGFLGRNLIPALERHEHSVFGVDRGEGDLAEPAIFDAILRSHAGVDLVVHLAALPGRLFNDEDPELTIRQNVLMTQRVAQACVAQGVRLCYVSTSEIYGDSTNLIDMNGNQSADEDCLPVPKNLYGATKLAGESVAYAYCPDVLILRPSMSYGPDMEVGYGRAALPTFIWNAMRGEKITVHHDSRRSWCYIDDLVEGMAVAIKHMHPFSWIVNVGRDDDERMMGDFAWLACQLTGADFDLIQYEHADPSITKVKRLSTHRLQSLGWRPKVDLYEGMKRCYEALKERDRETIT